METFAYYAERIAIGCAIAAGLVMMVSVAVVVVRLAVTPWSVSAWPVSHQVCRP